MKQKHQKKDTYIQKKGNKLLMNKVNNIIMEYQKIENLLDNGVASNQPSNFRTKKLVEINVESRGTYNTNAQIKFKATMLKYSLCDYADTYILVKETITVDETSAVGDDSNNTNKKVIFKNCAPVTDCISEINNAQVDNAKYIDTVMPMYNLVEYSDNYSKTSVSLWQYCKDISAINNNGDVVGFNGANATDSFNFKAKITRDTNDDGEINNVEIMVTLTYLSNFWGTLGMPLINCEVNLILSWFADCVIAYNNASNEGATFGITETKLHIPVVPVVVFQMQK